MNNNGALIIPEEIIMGKILLFRGIKVMIDSDLAELYGVSTKRLNEEDKMTVRKRIGFKRSGEN